MRSRSATTRSSATSSGPPTASRRSRLRFFNVYGSGQALSNPYTGVAAIFSSRLLNDNPPLIFEDGKQSRDFIHVSDIVEGIVCALSSDAAVGASINLGTGRAVSVNEMADLLADGLGKEIAPEHPGSYRAGDIRHCFADTTRARRAARIPGRGHARGRNRASSWMGPEPNRRATGSTKRRPSSSSRGLAR